MFDEKGRRVEGYELRYLVSATIKITLWYALPVYMFFRLLYTTKELFGL